MVMEAVFEILLHFDRFRNVDLYRQGMYYFKVYLYTLDIPLWEQLTTQPNQQTDSKTSSSQDQKSNGPPTLYQAKDIEALPYNIISSKYLNFAQSGLLSRNQADRYPPHVDPVSGQYYASKGFRIQFVEQIVILNEGCQFRLHLPAHKLSESHVYFDIELMFSEYHSSDYAREKPLPELSDFAPVCRKSFRLRGLEDGVKSFHPMTFDETHFCLLNMTVHSTLLNFQFRPNRKEQIIQAVTQADMTIRTRSPNPAVSKHKPKPKNLIHALYPQMLQGGTYSKQEIARIADQHHSFYVMSLVHAFNSLAKLYDAYTTSCLLPQDAAKYGLPTESEPIFLEEGMEEPGDDLIAPKSKYALPHLTKLSERMGPDITCQAVAERVQLDIASISSQIFDLWHHFLTVYPLYSSVITEELAIVWRREVKEHWGLCIFRETLTTADRTKVMDNHNIMMHSHASRVMKNSGHVLALDPLTIEDITLTNNMEQMVIIFEQSYNKIPEELKMDEPELLSETGKFKKRLVQKITKSDSDEIPTFPDVKSDPAGSSLEKKSPGKHVIVLVHGYQGNSWDMRMFRNYMAVLFPEFVYLLPTSNENRTEEDISEMGQRLAEEIVQYLRAHFEQDEEIERISFIAHSLGGVIIRTALACDVMAPFLSRLHTFFTLGSPHCGYLYNSNMLLNTGMWLLRKFYKSKSLEQLSLSDNEDMRETFMYKLSCKPGIGFFKNVLLVSSPADRYAPYHSVRIDLHEQAEKDRKNGVIYKEIVLNLQKQIRNSNFTRFDVCFMNNKSNLDTFIGRAAHICFLDQPLYILMFLVVYKDFFT
eukprot:TRINITY_DN6360_c0_g1_i3.p1 TRINITY_DN6360_c0_g1~~TRINITY_DN6360_c0_g1_i3.p1  ORF type:complete len:817 (-),score=152.00 TRINITY_DN6360_c0_g1_i3:462-2912(-)